MALIPGLRSFERIVVADTDTAVAMGSGDVPVLSTPRLLALAEAAAVAAVRPSLEPGQTSVGTSAVLEHNRPSPLGAEVVVEAELAEVDGRRAPAAATADDTFREARSHCTRGSAGALKNAINWRRRSVG